MSLRSRLNNFRRYLREKHDPLFRMQHLPRYTPGNFIVNGAEIIFPDASSFATTYKEIFFTDLYNFFSDKNTPFIIDCGANIGISIIYFKCLYPESEIIGFEPDKLIYSYLKRNISSFSFQKVKLINEGLWSEDKELEFHNEGADAGRILDNKIPFGNGVSMIKVSKLSKYIDKEVDFLKIDIEGAELNVINEIENKLHFIKRIFIEYHSFIDKRQELDLILDILTRNGFRYYIYSSSNIKARPFIDKNNFLLMDCLLNICAMRDQ